MKRTPITGTGRSIAFFLFLIATQFILFSSCCAGQSWIRVKWVADGDTIVLEEGRHVRYIGIDTPEIDHRHHRAEPMGYEAKNANRRLVEGWNLRLEFDQERYDRYGRTLAYVYRDDGLFVNAELLEQGFACVLTHFPNCAKEKMLILAQQKAMEEGRGIWKAIDKNALPSHGYQGNRRSKRFHAHDCKSGNKISRTNRIRFENKWAAFWQGYAPDKACIVFPGED